MENVLKLLQGCRLGRSVVRWVAGCPINLIIVAFIFADFETSGSTCRRCSIGCTAWRSRQWPSSQATRLPAARCWPQPATSGSWSTIPSSPLGSMRWGHYFTHICILVRRSNQKAVKNWAFSVTSVQNFAWVQINGVLGSVIESCASQISTASVGQKAQNLYVELTQQLIPVRQSSVGP